MGPSVRPKRTLDLDFPDQALLVSLFGADVYAVGGCVRDALRGRPTGEVDLLVARRPLDDIIALLKPHGKVDLVGRSFGVVKFTISGKTYDIALPRTDRAEARPVRGHKDILVTADPDLPVEKDLERRDFRCNSIAVRLADGLVIDPFRGRRDIERRVLRVTNAAAFPEDPLRVLRAARFAAVARLLRRPLDLPAGPDDRPVRAQRRAGDRGALQDPPLGPALDRASTSSSSSERSASSSRSSTP